MVRGTRAHAEALREGIAAVLATMGLRLSPDKTLITRIDERLDFLGWHIQRPPSSMTTDLVLDAVEHAFFSRTQEGSTSLQGLIAHSDAGSHLGGVHPAAGRRGRGTLGRLGR